MLSPEQSHIVREQIAKVLNVDVSRVVPAAKLVADLGATDEHLMPLRLAIEGVLPVQIEPIIKQVNARTTVDNGILTQESFTQIVSYLGEWPGQPLTPVSFPDLFTVAMIEAITAKALPDAPRTNDSPPTPLAPELLLLVHQAIANACGIPLERVHPDMEFIGTMKYVNSFIAAQEALNLDLEIERHNLRSALNAHANGIATELTMQNLRWLIPNIDSLPDDGKDHISTVGLIERLCAAAIARRGSCPVIWDDQSRHVVLGRYVSNWPRADQEWWANLPHQMGPERFRLYLIGMVRASSIECASLGGIESDILEVAEKYSETGHSPELLDKKFRSASSWKLRSNPGRFLCILRPACTLEDGGIVLAQLSDAFRWNQAQVIVAARAWHQSFISPLQDSSLFDPRWVTTEVANLARQMHSARNYVDLPKLGALLETAGCTIPEILEHCRDPQRRHLRGDWLISAILAVKPPAPPRPARGKAAAASKPKKIKFPTMRPGIKKHYKDQLNSHNGNVPVATAFASVWQSSHLADHDSFKRNWPNLSTEALSVLGGLYPMLRVVAPDVAIARRIELQSASELFLALAIYARISLVIWHTRPYRHASPECLQDAFAAGDTAAVRWAVRDLPHEPQSETEVASWTYLALRAVATRDEVLIAKLAGRWPHPATNNRASPLDIGLIAILRRDPAAVVNTLNNMLAEMRAEPEPVGYGAVYLTVHTIYRAASWLDPALVANFDVTQTFPWDAEFHAISSAAADPLEGFDFSNAPAMLCDILHTQVVPEWLRKLDQTRPKTESDDKVFVHITDVGPCSDAVFRIVARWGWSRDEFDHRMKMLPMTIHMSSYDYNTFAAQMEAAGATVEAS